MGKLRKEEDVLWSFAPHDISMILDLVNEKLVDVRAFGGKYLNNKVADLNNTNRGTQLQKTGSILSIPIIGGALKSGGRLARKISKWFGG